MIKTSAQEAYYKYAKERMSKDELVASGLGGLFLGPLGAIPAYISAPDEYKSKAGWGAGIGGLLGAPGAVIGNMLATDRDFPSFGDSKGKK